MASEHALGARCDVRGRAAHSPAPRAVHGLLRRPGGLPVVGDASRTTSASTASIARGPVRRLSARLPVRPLADGQVSATSGLSAAQASGDRRRPRNRLDRRHATRRGSLRSRSRSVGPCATLVAAAVLFNPAVIALSAVWGQVDAVPAMFVLWSLLLLFTSPPRLRYEIAAFLLFAVAIAIKPQSAFVAAGDAVRPLPPLPLPAVTLRDDRRRLQHRLDRGPLARCLARVGARRSASDRSSLVRFYRDAASSIAFTSANAFNLWGVVGFWRNDSVGRPRRLRRRHLCASTSGLLLFAAGTGVRALADPRGDRDAVRRRQRALTVAAASVALLAFALLTRMHERYMFLALVVFAPVDLPAAAADRVRGALGALPPQSLVPVRVLQHGLVARPGLPLQPVVRLAARRLRNDRGRRRSGPPSSPRSRSCVAWRGAQVGRHAPAAAGSARNAVSGPAAAAAPSRSTRAPRGRRRPEPTAARDGRTLGPARPLGLACLFRPRDPPRRDAKAVQPERQRVPPPDGALGGRADSRRARAARRLVSRTSRWARRSSTTTRASRTRSPPYRRASQRRGRPDDLPLDPLPAPRALADRGLPRRAPARLGPLDRGCRGRCLAARSSAPPATATSTGATRGAGYGVYSQLWANVAAAARLGH